MKRRQVRFTAAAPIFGLQNFGKFLGLSHVGKEWVLHFCFRHKKWKKIFGVYVYIAIGVYAGFAYAVVKFFHSLCGAVFWYLHAGTSQNQCFHGIKFLGAKKHRKFFFALFPLFQSHKEFCYEPGKKTLNNCCIFQQSTPFKQKYWHMWFL